MDLAALQQKLAQVGERGGGRAAPIAFRLLQTLCARMESLAPDVQALLAPRAAAALADCEAALRARRGNRPVAPRSPSALQQLNATLAQRRGTAGAQDPGLASAVRFRSGWARQAALQRVEVALARRPSKAGPLNSHAIAVESLALMRDLSPGYLQHFIQQVEALQQLESWEAQLAAAATTSARQAQARGTAKGASRAPGARPKDKRTG